MRSRDWIRIARYLDGEATPDEQRETAGWIAEDPARGELLEQLRTMRAAAAEGVERFPTDADAQWERVAARTTRLDEIRVRRSSSRPVAPFRVQPALVAGILLALVGSGAWLALHGPEGRDAPGAIGGSTTWTTQTNETARVALSDGSEVELGPASTLRQTAQLAREYDLVGVARFDVVRDTLRPFVVETAHGITRVLGTTFAVESRADDDATTVTVEEGSVAVRSTDAPGEVVLGAGESGRAWRGRRPLRFGAEAAVPSRFDGASLRTVLDALAVTHGVVVDVTDPALAEIRLSTDLTGLSLRESLEVLEATLEIVALVRGTRVLVAPSGGSR